MAVTTGTAKNFCTADDIGVFLGRTFTAEQLQAINALIPRAERFIEQECNRQWSSGPVINETIFAPYGLDPPSFFTSSIAGWVPIGSAIFLKETPVQSVQRVQGAGWLTSPDVTLIEGQEWEVRDLEMGLLRLTVPSAYYRLKIDYTPVAACPPDITQAAIALVSTWLRPMLNPDTFGTSWYQTPDISVHFSSGASSLGVSEDIQAILDNYRFRVIA